MPRSTAHSTGLVRAGVAEGALLGDDRSRVAAVLCVGGEAVGGERVGHHVHGGPDRALALGRRHAGGQRAAVLLADVRRHLLGLFGPQPLHRLAEQPHEEVVPALHEAERSAPPPRRSTASRAGPAPVALRPVSTRR